MVESFLECVDILFEVGFEGYCEDVVEAVEVILVIHILRVGSDVADPVELVGYFCGGPVGEEVVLLTIEIDPHEIHLQYVPYKLLGGSIPVEEGQFIMAVDSPGRYLVDFNPK